MANIVINVRVGSHPLDFKKGFELYFSNGNMDTKMSPQYISDLVFTAIEKELKFRNIDTYSPFGAQHTHAASPEGDICPHYKGQRCDPVESTEMDHPACPECGGTGKRRAGCANRCMKFMPL